VLGILDVQEGDGVLMDEFGSLTLEIDLDAAGELPDALWDIEGQRCAAQGALVRRQHGEPFLVVERVVTAKALGIQLDE
jgi:hypothetical protein